MWLRFYGANSLVAYMVGDHVDFSSITNSIFLWISTSVGQLLRCIRGFRAGNYRTPHIKMDVPFKHIY